jgi:3,4-dihydroxy 2-butanone 4-phosphate synthase/GTP cyclohydrolase II
MDGSVQTTAAVATAIETLRTGGTIVITDGDGRLGGLGTPVMAAEHADAAALMAFAKRAPGSYLALTDQRCEELGLDLVAERDDLIHPPITATIRARDVSSGVGFAERARSIAVAIDPGCGPDDISIGGNVLPLRARPGGVLERAGMTEASTDLLRLGGLVPAAVHGEILNLEGNVARGEEVVEFAEREGLPTIAIAEIIAHRRRSERLVRRIVSTSLATVNGVYQAVGYLGNLDDAEHVALIRGEVAGQEDVLVYIHRACWEGDVFRSKLCDCRARLDAAEEAIDAAGRGVLVHLAHPGYHSHQHRTHDDQVRDTGLGAQILAELGLTTITVLTDHVRPYVGLEGYGLTVTGHRPLLSATG